MQYESNDCYFNFVFKVSEDRHKTIELITIGGVVEMIYRPSGEMIEVVRAASIEGESSIVNSR